MSKPAHQVLREHQCAKRIIEIVAEGAPCGYFWWTHKSGAKGKVRGVSKRGREIVVTWTHCPTQRDAETIVPGVMFMAGIRHVDLKPCVICPLQDLDANGQAWIADGQRKISLAESMGNQLLDALLRPEKFDRLPENETSIIAVDEMGRPINEAQRDKLRALEGR